MKGFNLSDKVWNYAQQFKGDIELGLDLGLSEGKSAADLSQNLREYLYVTKTNSLSYGKTTKDS